MGIRSLAISVLGAVACIAWNGCANSAGVSAVVHATPSPTLGPDRLYAGVSGSKGVYTNIFSLPISNSSVPVATLPGKAYGTGWAFDSTERLFAARYVYAQPIVDGASPAFSLPIDGAGHAFDSAGNLFTGGNCSQPCTSVVSVLYAPITSTSTVSYSINIPGHVQVYGVAFDRNGNLWVAGNGFAPAGGLLEYTPPYGSNSVPAIDLVYDAWSVGFDSSGDMYVGSNDGIDVFVPPFNPSMKKSFAITSVGAPGGGNGLGPLGIAFDSAGNMYSVVGDSCDCTEDLVMFSRPFSSSSQPVVTLRGPYYGGGIAIGP